MKKTALITGGAGFIGSHLAHRLLKEDWNVTIVDNLFSGYRTNIPAGADYIWLDVSKDDLVCQLPKISYDAVFHLASHVGQEISFDNPVYDFKTNGLSTVSLLNWCLTNKIRKFVFASSMNVYGEPDSLPVTENHAIKPPSPYAVGKISSEYYCSIYNHFGIESTCLRLFNVYGAGQDMENLKQGMVSIYMAYIAKGLELPVKGSLERFRDFVYVTDVADAFVRCLSPNASGKVYNVATGRKTYVKELIESIANAFGHAPGTYPVKQDNPTRRDQFGIYGDYSRIQTDLGWEPTIQLDQGIRLMADWVKMQKK